MPSPPNVPAIRPARWPQDLAALSALDTAFITDTVYRVLQDGLSFRLVAQAVTPPLSKRYPFDPSDPAERAAWQYAAVAEVEGQIAGFAAAQSVAWNRRTVLWHLYVAPAHRGRGIGTALLESVAAFARESGARCLWVETQNVNAPAVRFYLGSGFTLCGLDTSLYEPDDPAGGEVALFLTRPVPFEAALAAGRRGTISQS